MNPATIDATLDLMTPAEIRRGLWFVGVWQQAGGMGQAEADEWRRRIAARLALMDLLENGPAN